MRNLITLAALAAVSCMSMAQSHMRQGYVTKNGTYVAPSYATNPNATTVDNYSTKGNVNPYTGQAGTRAPTPTQIQPMQPVQPIRIYQPPQEPGGKF